MAIMTTADRSALMKLIPDKPIYCTANAVKFLRDSTIRTELHVIKTETS